MAVAELIVSCRALLGAAFAVPLVPFVHPEPVEGAASLSAPPELVKGAAYPELGRRAASWRNALARFHHAEAVLKAAEHEPGEDLYGDLIVASTARCAS